MDALVDKTWVSGVISPTQILLLDFFGSRFFNFFPRFRNVLFVVLGKEDFVSTFRSFVLPAYKVKTQQIDPL